jgi:ABC-type branched-subunit amino acid transport system ATPase component
VVRPAEGRVELFGHDITHSPTQARARSGLGRTFQRMELFDTSSVRDNVSMGAEAATAGRNPLSHLVGKRGTRAEHLRRADEALDQCGIRDLAQARPLELSTGQRRLVELARVCAGHFRMLLLDEPSSGLDGNETERFGEILLDLIRERGLGILIVEHDMSLVMSVCDYLYVLDFGKPIFEGTPTEVQSSPIVRAAYLGSEAPELVEA